MHWAREPTGLWVITLLPSQHCAPHLLSAVSKTDWWQFGSLVHRAKHESIVRDRSLCASMRLYEEKELHQPSRMLVGGGDGADGGVIGGGGGETTSLTDTPVIVSNWLTMSACASAIIDIMKESSLKMVARDTTSPSLLVDMRRSPPGPASRPPCDATDVAGVRSIRSTMHWSAGNEVAALLITAKISRGSPLSLVASNSPSVALSTRSRMCSIPFDRPASMLRLLCMKGVTCGCGSGRTRARAREGGSTCAARGGKWWCVCGACDACGACGACDACGACGACRGLLGVGGLAG